MSIAVQRSSNWTFDGRPSGELYGETEFERHLPPREATETENELTSETTEEATRLKTVRKDKLAFVLGVLHFWVCAYWLGSYPSTFYKLYSVEAFILFPLRWKSFKKMKMHYYMFDFCYLANLLLLVFLWVFPKSPFLFKVLFAYNSGPLAWAIVLFKNSLVYHSLSEVTSLFMHWYPMLVSWTLRWYPDCEFMTCGELNKFDAPMFEAKLSELLIWPMAPYIAWAIFYYLKLFVVSSNKIRDRGYQTLYTYMLEEANFTLLKRIVYKFGPRWRPLVYMCIHLLLVLFSLSACILWWNSFLAHSTWLAVATLSSAWNGASHYFY